MSNQPALIVRTESSSQQKKLWNRENKQPKHTERGAIKLNNRQQAQHYPASKQHNISGNPEYPLFFTLLEAEDD